MGYFLFLTTANHRRVLQSSANKRVDIFQSICAPLRTQAMEEVFILRQLQKEKKSTVNKTVHCSKEQE